MPRSLEDYLRVRSRVRKLPGGDDLSLISPAEMAEGAALYGQSLRRAETAALKAGFVPERYSKNFRFMNRDNQITLLNSMVVLVGLGGLGGLVLDTLCRLGVGRIIAFDGDHFEAGNINRQALCTMDTLGRPKTQAAKARIKGVNPAVELDARPHFADRNDILCALDGADLLMDALGGLDDRPMLLGAARDTKTPLVTAAVAGFSGSVATVLPHTPDPPVLEASPGVGAEEVLGCPAPGVNTAASLMCAEAMNLILGQPPALAGKLLLFDLSDMTFDTVTLA